MAKILTTKFCGLNTPHDMQVATDLGVSAVGLVFYPKSVRSVSIAQAKQLVQLVPAFTSVVALVVNMPKSELIDLSQALPFDVVQFHGDESAAQCQQLAGTIGKRWLKAIAVKPCDTSKNLLEKLDELAYHGASAVILDSFSDGVYGGTGRVFDWTKIPQNSSVPIYLAGGLTPDNIKQVLSDDKLMAKISGVDVSGGIEQQKGIKCPHKMRAFVSNIRQFEKQF